MSPIKPTSPKRNPRILVVTPEIAYLPLEMDGATSNLTAKAGGLADVSASLIAKLHNLGADVHVAMPNYRRMFHIETADLLDHEMRVYHRRLSNRRIHLAEDRAFYYCSEVYSQYYTDNLRAALAFQREVVNNIIPEVAPDLIHCNDWMTGLIPAAARRMHIPSLFTFHNIHTCELTLEEVEDAGIDAANFWRYLYYSQPPSSYEETRSAGSIDLLTSAIFSSHFINTVSQSFLDEVIRGQHSFIDEPIRREIENKMNAGCATGILNAPDEGYHPSTDALLEKNYDHKSLAEGKAHNKIKFQQALGLRLDPDAPLLFWPSRLDGVQKGCELLSQILYSITHDYAHLGLQVAFVASGPFARHFQDIIAMHGLHDRVALHGFTEGMSHLGYAASDFILMPSSFEPCGLPQMIGCIYGSLPIVHDTGGLHDTITDLDAKAGSGNGFSFTHHDAGGLRWAVDQAMNFWKLPAKGRNAEIARVMQDSETRFTHDTTARQYIDIYERMLERSLVV